MTTQAQQPLPRLLQPTAKSAPVTSSTDFAGAANDGPAVARGQSQARSVPRRPDGEKIDATNEKATLALIRRVLAPDINHASETPGALAVLEGWLPPLTSSNDVDVQLYAIIAIVVKDLVNSWYQNITPDHSFVDEGLQIIAHCSRALEQRARRINVEELILDEVPTILLQHLYGKRKESMLSARLMCEPSL